MEVSSPHILRCALLQALAEVGEGGCDRWLVPRVGSCFSGLHACAWLARCVAVPSLDFNQCPAHAAGMIEFGRVAFLGTVLWNPTDHSPSNREVVHRRLDELMQHGELSWSAARDRCVRFTCGTIDVVTRELPDDFVSPSPSRDSPSRDSASTLPPMSHDAGPTVLESYGLDEVFNVVYLDDSPSHLMCFFAGPAPKRATCTVVQVPSPEVALAMCEVFENVANFVHQQAILQSVDDNIMAAVEGRSTASQMQRDEDRRLRRMSWAVRGTQPETDNPRAGGERVGRRGSFKGAFKRGDVDLAEGEEDDIFETFAEGRVTRKFDLAAPSRLAARPSLVKGFRPPPAKPRDGGGPAVRPAATPHDTAALERALNEYMELLKANLSADEMMQFKVLVSAYRKQGAFRNLSAGLLDLFGPSRKHLLPGLQNFVPKQDAAQYEEFMARQQAPKIDRPAALARAASVREGPEELEFYMLRLKQELTGSGEMQAFALLLRQYRTGSDFASFSSGLQEVFGPKRTSLLPGMRHFVHAVDRPLYEAFLKEL